MKILKSCFSCCSLKHLLERQIIPQHKQRLNVLRKQKGEKIISNVKVNDAVLGMRGLPVLFHDGSSLDHLLGIKFRGYSIPQFVQRSQKVSTDQEPLPEAIFFLLLTGKYPSDSQLQLLQNQWKSRQLLSDNIRRFILSLPKQFHPMTMLSMSLLYLQNQSKFFQAYQNGVNKSKYWQFYYEDAMDLLSKLPQICAYIYRHKYKDSIIIQPDKNLDWAGNFSHMLGFQDKGMKQCLRGYISIHADHEGGNVSAHTCHLVGSALSDPYLSYSAALNGLAGPLHGLANQQSLRWLMTLKDQHQGEKPNSKIISDFVYRTLGQGKVVPGYGHAVLRNTDPRFIHMKKFADKHIKDDQIIDLAVECYKIIPGILSEISKIKNPYPNVDAFSGACLNHYGIHQYDFYTVVFGLSRALGCLSNGIWARAFGLPIQRPNSIDLAYIQRLK